MHPNQRAALCAIGCLSGAGLALDGGIMEGLSLAATNYLAVLATRSRVAFWGLNFALTVFLLSAFSIAWTALMMVALISAAVALVLALPCRRGLKLLELVSQFVLLGRTKSEVQTLNGRIRLWTELLPIVRHRWLGGYGYGAFWTRARVEEIFLKTRWPFSDSHSCYIEAAIQGGVVALALWILLLITLIEPGATRGLAVNPLSAAFVSFVAIHGLAEATFFLPSFACFALLFLALAHCG